MSLLNHFHKKPLLSQFLLGILAIFSLPEIQVSHESEQTIINQPLMQVVSSENEVEQHGLFLAEIVPVVAIQPLQAVKFPLYFTKAYQFDGDLNHPIRAGPTFI